MYSWARYHAKLWLALILTAAITAGCGGNPFLASSIQIQSTGSSGSTPGGTDPGEGGDTGGLSQFINVSLANTTLTTVHYYLHFFAFHGPGSTVSDDDLPLYEGFGYLRTGSSTFSFGSVTVTAPAGAEILWYWHERGRFPASSIRPATLIGGVGGTITPTFDDFFDQNGVLVPVPDLILFYRGDPAGSLCSIRSYRSTDVTGQFDLEWFNPTQIQGSGCNINCLAQQDPFQRLAPLTRSPTNAFCNEYFRGSVITYEFRGLDPAGPGRLLWQVTLAGNDIHTPTP